MQAKIDDLARQPRQVAQGTAIAQADCGGTAIVNNNITGSSPDEVALSLRAAGVAAQAKIDELAGQLRTSSEAVLGFFKILQEEDVPVEQLPTKLTLIAQRYVGIRSHSLVHRCSTVGLLRYLSLSAITGRPLITF